MATRRRKAPKRRTLTYAERKFIAEAIHHLVTIQRVLPVGDMTDSDNAIRESRKLRLAQDVANGNVILETRP